MRLIFSLCLSVVFAFSLNAEEINTQPAVGAFAKPAVLSDNPSEKLPEKYDERVTLTERFGDQIPLELEFYDHQGVKRPLKEFITDGKAIVLNLVYFNCPSICNEVLNSLTQTVRSLPWDIGENFKLLTVSIDPTEKYPLAFRKRHSYLEYYGKPVKHEDWVFLTGQKEEIQVLADSVGFGFEYLEETGEYAHPSATILLSPEGKVMRYLEGVVVTPLNLKMGLIESGQGRVGNSIDRALLRYCYAYDPTARGYSLMAKNVMAGGGAVTLVLMSGVMFFFWRREVRSGGIK